MEEVYHQLICLLLFGVTGVVIGILFDIFRIWRRSFKTADWLTCLQDILFWLLTGLIILFSIFQFNHGEIRSYVFVGIAIGIILYMITISRFVVQNCVKVIQWIKKIISYPIKILLQFIKRISRKPVKLCNRLLNKIKKVFNKKHVSMTKKIKKRAKKKWISKKKKEFYEKCRKNKYSML